MEKWAAGITDIVQADLGATPASINRETGVMFVNPKYKLNRDQWYFIMLHELGHLKKKTKNELEADKWAHEQYLKEGGSLKQSVYALTDLLNYNKPEDMARAHAQLRRAQIKDGKPMNYSGDINPGCYKTEYSNFWLPYGFSSYDSRYNEYFLGKFGTWVKEKALPTIGNVAGSLLGINNQQAGQDTSLAQVLAAQEIARQQEAQRKAESQKTMLVIVAAIVLVLIIGGITVFALKKK